MVVNEKMDSRKITRIASSLDNLPLSIREWDCPSCKQHNDRDENAALNIRGKGIKDLNLCGIGMLSHIKQKLAEAPALAGS